MGADNLDGKVGRMYVPRQEIGSIALRKMKARNTPLADLQDAATWVRQRACVPGNSCGA